MPGSLRMDFDKWTFLNSLDSFWEWLARKKNLKISESDPVNRYWCHKTSKMALMKTKKQTTFLGSILALLESSFTHFQGLSWPPGNGEHDGHWWSLPIQLPFRILWPCHVPAACKQGKDVSPGGLRHQQQLTNYVLPDGSDSSALSRHILSDWNAGGIEDHVLLFEPNNCFV